VLGHEELGKGGDLVTRRLSNDGAHIAGERGVENSAEDGLRFKRDGGALGGGYHAQNPVGKLMMGVQGGVTLEKVPIADLEYVLEDAWCWVDGVSEVRVEIELVSRRSRGQGSDFGEGRKWRISRGPGGDLLQQLRFHGLDEQGLEVFEGTVVASWGEFEVASGGGLE
jgi:uncharacterized protein (AIM24 family)